MHNKWTSHLSTDSIKKEEFKNAVKASSIVLSRLVDILTKDIEVNRREQKKIDLYDCPNWQLLQADCNATQRTLEKIITICKLKAE